MQNYNKFILALLAAAGVIASSHLLSGNVEEWVNVSIAAVSAALIYWVPNIPKPPARPNDEGVYDVATLTPPVDPHQPIAEPPRPSLADDKPGPAEDDDTGTPVK